MGSDFDSFNASELGAFIESALGERGGQEILRSLFASMTSNLQSYDPDADAWTVESSSGGLAVTMAWHDGDLWIGGSGLSRFEGVSTLVSYTLQVGASVYSDIKALYTRPSGELVCAAGLTSGVGGRVFEYDRTTDSWSNLGAEFASIDPADNGLRDVSGVLHVVMADDSDMVYSWNGSTWSSTGTISTNATAPTRGTVLGSETILLDAQHPDATGLPGTEFAADNSPCSVATTGGDATPIVNTYYGTSPNFQYRFKTDDSPNPRHQVIGAAIYCGGFETDAGLSQQDALLKITTAGIQVVEESDNVVVCTAGTAEDLFVGGSFTTFGGVTVDNAARITAGVVSALGTIAGTVEPRAMVTLNSSVAAPTITAVDAHSITTAAYSKQLQADQTILSWRLVVGPSGATISTAGLVEWASPVKSGTPHTFTVYAGNDGGLDTETWALHVQDTAPTINALGDDSWIIGFHGPTYTRTATLSAGDAIIDWSLDTAPSGASIDSSGVITWPAVAGTVDWTVRATNLIGSDTESWQTTVT